MKTINFLTSHFIPENTACTNRVLSFVNELEKIYKVNVICLTEKGVEQEKHKVNYTNNTTIYYINQKKSSDTNFFIRAYKEILYIRKLVKISNKIESDLTIATSPYIFMIPFVSTSIKGKKILDIRDLVWEYIAEKNFLKKIIKKTFKVIMHFSIKKFDHVLVTNEREKEILEKHYIAKHIDIVPNGITLQRCEDISRLLTNINENQFTVTYIGNIGFAHNLKLLVSVAKEFPNSRFFIIGDGMELKSIKEYALKYNIDNVVFTGKLNWNEIKPYYEETTVLYAQLQERLPSAMPSKLFEYASTGLPVLFGGTGFATTFVKQLEQSKVIKPDNFEALKKAIGKMQNMKFKISNNNKKLVKEHYLREQSSAKFVSIINKYL